jgi:hypothetical protein
MIPVTSGPVTASKLMRRKCGDLSQRPLMCIAERCHCIQSVQSVQHSRSLARLEYTVKVDEVLTKPGVEVDVSTLRLIVVEGVCLLQC